jgi:type II secretory pathway component PulJ
VSEIREVKSILVKANTPTQETLEKMTRYKKSRGKQDQELDTRDYTQLNEDLASMRDNTSLLTSILGALEQQDQSTQDAEQRKKKQELLQDIMRTVVRDKEKMATELPNIRNDKVMENALQVNELLQKAIVAYRGYMNQQKEKAQEPSEPTATTPVVEEKEFVSDQHLEDLENDEMQQLRKELGLDANVTSEPVEQEQGEQRLPWEDEDDL